MRSHCNIQEQDNVSHGIEVQRPTPISYTSLQVYSLPPYISLYPLIPVLAHQGGPREVGMVRRSKSPSVPDLCLPLSFFQRQSRSRITNDIMTILHALQSSDVLPTHLLWYLVTDPAVNQGRVVGIEAHLLLSLANDLEGNRGCQCLQHVLHWQSSRALSKTLSYKLCRSLRF